jgi:hypothetical protein
MAAIRRESALARIELASIGSDKNFVDLTCSQRVASGFRGGLCNDPPEPAQPTPQERTPPQVSSLIGGLTPLNPLTIAAAAELIAVAADYVTNDRGYRKICSLP